jgi:hypothetical protein
MHTVLALLVLVPLLPSQESRPGSRPTAPAHRAPTRSVEPESDKKAVAIAEKVLLAMGGDEALDKLQCLQWTFFNRTHTWDRKNGRHRLEVEGREGNKTLMLRDLKAGTCRVFVGGQEVVDEAELADHKTNAEGMFVNDTYWFLFPAKLLDPGVVLALEADQKVGDLDCNVLRVRFKSVGLTPNNEYLAFVDKKTARVVRWTYFKTKDTPGQTWDWGPYERIGGVLFASKHKAVDHKRDVDITGMKAFEQCKDEWFAPPAPGKG